MLKIEHRIYMVVLIYVLMIYSQWKKAPIYIFPFMPKVIYLLYPLWLTVYSLSLQL